MYGIALSVAACLRGGTRVDVAWNLDPHLAPGFDPNDAVAITPGGGRLGSLFGGALDSRLIEEATAEPTVGRVLSIELGPLEANLIGAEVGTRLRIGFAPGELISEAAWDRFLDRESLDLAASTEGDAMTAFAVAATDARASSVRFEDDSIAMTWSPRTTLVVLGQGPMAAAVAEAGSFVGWSVEPCSGPEPAIGLAANLSPIDGIVVTGHDTEAVGRVLQAALGSSVGYIGSIGPMPMQEARAEWLAYRGLTELGRVAAPAGLDIGASSPPEVAISVVAEMLATLDGASGLV